jgi:YihY family inner membrane protein
MSDVGKSLGAGLRALDRLQQRDQRIAFIVAVLKKFADDNAGQLAGLIAYYAFFSLFPLLLVMVGVLGVVLDGDPSLQRSIVNSTIAQFPGIGDSLKRSVSSLHPGAATFAIGAVTALTAGLGVTRAAQTAFDRLWDVPSKRRHGFVPARLRGLALLGLLGVGNIGSFVLTGAIDSGAPSGTIATLGAIVLSCAINFGLFMATFSLLTSYPASAGELWPGAAVAAIAWVGLQHAGGWLVLHHVRHASEVYGLFAFVIGLLFFLYLAAQLTLFAAEINVVRSRHLWPRSVL